MKRGVKSALICGALGTGFSSLLAGCASVTAIPLEADGLNAVPGAQPGFRYYIPRPYLLVAEAPAAKAGGGAPQKPAPEGEMPPKKPPPKDAQKDPAKDAARDGKRIAGAPPDPTNKKTDSTTSDGGDGSKPASTPATDTSFQIGDSGKTYIAKLIYLPDYSRPMAVELNTGLVGISRVDMTLQDGWMLTNVSANADNSKMGDVLTAAIQALSTSATGGASKAATAASGAAKKAGAPPPHAPPNQVLRPGLYAFDYNYGMSRVSFLCAVAYFGPGGSEPATGPGACGPDYSRPIPPPVSARY
jgi:hypothetical protein